MAVSLRLDGLTSTPARSPSPSLVERGVSSIPRQASTRVGAVVDPRLGWKRARLSPE